MSRLNAVTDFTVPLPATLSKFGSTTLARLSGCPDGPIIAVLGGISGNRFVDTDPEGGGGWWKGVVGPGCAIDPQRHLILGLDFAADPTGKSAPTTYEQAEVLGAALALSGRSFFDAIVAASYGGMVALAFAERAPDHVRRLVIVSAPAWPHPFATGLRELQRRIVDLGLRSGNSEAALSIARGLAMLSYRTAREFEERFEGGLPSDCPLSTSATGAYLRSRGEAFGSVMSPHRFLSLSASIDRHQIRPEHIHSPALLIGASTDQLVPPGQIVELSAKMAGTSQLCMIDSPYGHDMFLKEAAKISPIITHFLSAE